MVLESVFERTSIGEPARYESARPADVARRWCARLALYRTAQIAYDLSPDGRPFGTAFL